MNEPALLVTLDGVFLGQHSHPHARRCRSLHQIDAIDLSPSTDCNLESHGIAVQNPGNSLPATQEHAFKLRQVRRLLRNSDLIKNAQSGVQTAAQVVSPRAVRDWRKNAYASNTSTLPTDPLKMDSDKVTQILCEQGILK